MISFVLEGDVDDDGRITLTLPPTFRASHVEVEVRTPPRVARAASREEYLRRLEELAGSIDDPTFFEPDDPPPPPIELWFS